MQSHKFLIALYDKEKDEILHHVETTPPRFNDTKEMFFSWLNYHFKTKESQMDFLYSTYENICRKRARNRQEILPTENNAKEDYIASIFELCQEELMNIYSEESRRKKDFKIQIYGALNEAFAKTEWNDSRLKEFFVIKNTAVPFFMKQVQKGFKSRIYNLDHSYEPNMKELLDYYEKSVSKENKNIYLLVMNPDILGSIAYYCHSLNLLNLKDAVNHPNFKNFVNKQKKDDFEDGTDYIISEFFKTITAPNRLLVDAIIKNKHNDFEDNLIVKKDLIHYKSTLTDSNLRDEYEKNKQK